MKWRADGIRGYARAYRALAGWDRAQRVPVRVEPGPQPVIICVFRRLERLPRMLAMLAAQDIPVQLLIWDNSGDPETVGKAVAGARIPVTVHHSRRNIGGAGRFYLAREAALRGHRRVVFADDDQDFGPTAVRDLLTACPDRALAGWFAFRFTVPGVLGDRCPAGGGEPADYAGTGGMAADSAVFTDPGLFRCPRRFWFAEDLWLCHVARLGGYQVVGAAADFRLEDDGRDQCHRLGWVKKRLMRHILSATERTS